MRRSHQYHRGFTLLEILMALSLTAMLLTMLTAGVYGVVRDWDNNAEGLERTLEQSTALLQLERALQGAFPHSYRNTNTLGREVYFDGLSAEVAWVSSVSPQRNSGLTAWRLYSVNDQGVFLQLAPALSDHPGQRLRDAEAILLIDGYQAEFSYLFEDLQFERRWREDWDGALLQSLPLAVHMRLTPMGPGNDRMDEVIDVIAPIRSTQHRSIQPTQAMLQ